MNSFLFYLKGYVRVRVYGYGVTRFINICNKRGLCLREIEQGEEEYIFHILISDFKKIQDIVRKTKVKVVIVSKHGLPFFFWHVLTRKCFVIGAILCLFMLIYLSRFIWAIDIEGNVSISDEMILDYLKENNIQIGSKSDSVDEDGLEKSFRKDFDEITWISIGQEGTVLTIDIKERDVAVYEEKTYSASSLYASNDGIVVSIVVRSGIAQVKKGDVVTKGQLLVDGVLPVVRTDGTITDYNLVNADADILIQYTQNYEEQISFYTNEKIYTGESYKEFNLRLGNKIYKLKGFHPTYNKEDVIESFYQLKLWEHFYLPVWFGVKEYCEYEIIPVKKDKKVLEEQLYENLTLFLESLEEKGVQNMQKDVKISTSGSMLVLSGELQLVDSVMLREEIDPSIRTELINGQHNTINNGDEH